MTAAGGHWKGGDFSGLDRACVVLTVLAFVVCAVTVLTVFGRLF